MQKLILVRHGETQKNIVSQVHASNDPEELNSTGKKQVQKAASRLKDYQPLVLFCSKEIRAQQSANIIAEQLGISANSIEGLAERNWGELSGKPWTEIKAILDPMTLEERYTYIPPAGESWQQFEERLASALKSCIKQSDGKNIVILTHAGAIRAFIPYLLNISKDKSFNYDPDNASLSIFNYDGTKFSEEVINDTTHLKVDSVSE